ncbi:DeoR family transcriptional regulator, partial [Streptomyces sp. NPDC056983]
DVPLPGQRRTQLPGGPQLRSASALDQAPPERAVRVADLRRR